MKRLLIIASWYDPTSNVGVFFRVQAEILAKHFDVTMCFPSSDVKEYDNSNFKLFSFKELNTKYGSSMWNAFLAKFTLKKTAKKIIKDKEFDFCIAQNVIIGGFIAYELKRSFNIPYITIHHTPYIPGPNYFNDNWRVGRVLKNSVDNFVVSNDLLRQFRNAGRNEKMKILHNPVTVKMESNSLKSIKSEQILVAISGQFNVKFNHELFFSSLNFISDEILFKIKILWLGYNSWGGGLSVEDVILGIKRYYSKTDLNIQLHSSLKTEEMINLLANSDLYVHTSFTETFGITSLEAMKLGVPVISTQNGGINEYAIQNVNSVIVNSFDAAIFGKALQNTLENLSQFDYKKVQKSVEHVATEDVFISTLSKAIG